MQPDLFCDPLPTVGEIDFSLPVLSIRQPWASLIVRGRKDVENRTWRTNVRGPVLIHAGLRKDDAEMLAFVRLKRERGIVIPECGQGKLSWWGAPAGGIIGMAEIVDCVDKMDSPWFTGPWGFVLRHARPLPFFPCKGKLGFFRIGKEGR